MAKEGSGEGAKDLAFSRRRWWVGGLFFTVLLFESIKVTREQNKGIRDAGSTADFRILFEIFETLKIFFFVETFNFLKFLIFL